MGILIRKCDWEIDAVDLTTFLPREQIERVETLRRNPAHSVVLIVADSRNIIGWAVAHKKRREDLGWLWDDDAVRSLTGTNACLEYLHIHEEFRRRGLGAELMARMEEELRKAGKRTIYLHCATENTAAQKLYENSGWLIEKNVRPQWSQGREFLIYWKRLEELDNNARHRNFVRCA